VTAARNLPGSEWDTAGVAYGEPPNDNGCFVFDEQTWQSDPARFEYTRTRVGRQDDPDSEWISAMAVHPNAIGIEVTIDGSAAFTVRTESLPGRPDGPRFAAFSAPSDTNTIDIALIDKAGRVLGQHRDAIPRHQ
jgi:hypothetical protein